MTRTFENPSENMYLNFGEIGSNIKQLVESFTKQKSITQKVDSIQGIHGHNRINMNFGDFNNLF